MGSGLTIKELLLELTKQLETLPEDTRIVISGYEGGMDDVTNVNPVKVALNVNKHWYYGAHEELNEVENNSNSGEEEILYKEAEKVIVIKLS